MNDPDPDGAAGKASRARGGVRIRLLLFVCVALAALFAALVWRVWQDHRAGAVTQAGVSALSGRVATLEDALASLQQERAGLRQRLQDADTTNRALREQLFGLDLRTRTLEGAVASLSEQHFAVADALRLDEVEMLLRMAQERYLLFHDAAGALQATTLAGQVLAAVSDPAYAELAPTVEAQRQALLAAQLPARTADLATLGRLRAQVPLLPIRRDDRASTASPQGVLARIGAALSGLVRIQRSAHAPLAAASAGLARELLMLDLAQAQSALLAWDRAGFHAALQDARTLLVLRFDPAADDVRAAAADLARLLAQPQPAAAPDLDAALAQLRNLRATHALKPVVPATVPAKGRAR